MFELAWWSPRFSPALSILKFYESLGIGMWIPVLLWTSCDIWTNSRCSPYELSYERLARWVSQRPKWDNASVGRGGDWEVVVKVEAVFSILGVAPERSLSLCVFHCCLCFSHAFLPFRAPLALPCELVFAPFISTRQSLNCTCWDCWPPTFFQVSTSWSQAEE